jgi:hypothetical protein
MSCSSHEDTNTSQYQDVKGRSQIFIYRIKTPHDWKKIYPQIVSTDTKIALCEFFIEDIRITLHNFPSQTFEDRIPPGSQIARWKKQLPMVYENITPQAFSGYVGYLYEGDDGETAMMGWIMQLGPEQYSRLSLPDIPPELRSDVTIKAQGPLHLIQKHRQKIISFARSFELIQEIPSAS